MKSWRNFLVSPETPLVDAARVIDVGGGQIAIVADKQDHLLGTVTDADLRKALLHGHDFQRPCAEFMSRTPISLPVGSTRDECIQLMLHRHIGQLPLVDHHRRVKDVILITELYLPELQPNPIVIMAGGLGSRLAALTHRTPKPMLQVGGKPLIETLIVELSQQGFKNFYVSVNYKAEVITEFLEDGSKWGVNINFLREKKRLGTAGALKFLPEGIKEDVVVINGDILSKIDVRRMLLFHRRVGAAATMAVKDFDLTVPYGVVDIDDENNIVRIEEKPKRRVFINAGIYTLSPSTLGYIPKDEFFDATSLLELCKASGQKTCAYPLREYWIDIGHMKNFEQANFEFDQIFAP